MRRQVGICLELNHDRSIFLMKNGRIVKGTPAGNPSIGEETSFYPFEKKSANHWQPILAPLVAATAAIMLFMSALIFPTEEAFGYVQVQINPGIELGINDQYEVISIRELNSDGYDLIHQLGDWEGDSLHAVLDRVFELAVTEQTTQVTVTAIEEDGSKLDQSIKKVLMAVSSNVKNQEFAIQMKEATKKQWRQSKEDQVPVGQMIKEAEILKVQKPSEIQETEKEVPQLPAPSENKARIEQIKQRNSEEKNDNTPANDKKAVPSAEEKKSLPPAAETKKDNHPAKSEAQQNNQKQDNQKQNNNIQAPSTKPQKAPIKEQEKGKPTKSAPKEKPAVKKENNQPVKKEKSQPEKKEKSQPEKKEKKQPEKKEKNQPEKEKQGNGEAPGQQKKNDTPAARSDSSNKDKSQKSPETIQPDQSKKNERQKLERKEKNPAHENKQGKKEKE